MNRVSAERLVELAVALQTTVATLLDRLAEEKGQLPYSATSNELAGRIQALPPEQKASVVALMTSFEVG